MISYYLKQGYKVWSGLEGGWGGRGRNEEREKDERKDEQEEEIVKVEERKGMRA